MPPLVADRLPRRRCVEAGANYPIGNLPLQISLAPAYPGYYLVRRRYVGRILADRRDPCRTPFAYEWDVRRKLRAHDRGRRQFDRRVLKPIPKRDRNNRWQLELQFRVDGRRVRTPYHCVVGLSVCPCSTDEEGYEVDPFFVQLGGLTQRLWDNFWEVHHGNWDARDNTAGNLFVLWHDHHRPLQRLP